MKILILTLLLTLSIAAKTVDVASYATPNDGVDDTAAFQSAINAVKNAGGGTITVSDGTWDINGRLYLSGYVSYKFDGDKGSIISIDNEAYQTFNVGNVNQIEFRDLIFIGHPTGFDTWTLVYISASQQLRVTGCQFFGISAHTALFEIGSVDAVFDGNQFEGSGGGLATIYANASMRNLKVLNSTFLDYANFNGTFYSKPSGQAWVMATGNVATINATAPTAIVIDGNRFDEAPYSAITITNARSVTVRNTAINVSSYATGAGIRLNNVRSGVIENSIFGYATLSRPAIVAQNSTQLRLENLEFGNSVFPFTADATSTVDTVLCEECY